MLKRHVTAQLSAYHHGELSASEKALVETHLSACAKCRRVDNEIQFGVRLASMLTVNIEAPSAVSMPTAPPVGAVFGGSRRPKAASTLRGWLRPAPAIAAAVGFAIIVLLVFSHLPAAPSWEVTGLPGTRSLKVGQTLQTDSNSKADVKIANIGHLTVNPNTRIRLLATYDNEHRIALDRGKVEALTWAPPRLFIVETPLAKAVDLGCKYTLEVEDNGSSLLHVTLGLVALERDGRETIVPAGAFCRTRSGAGPGTPFFEDASEAFQAALDKVDSLPSGAERDGQLEAVLREARVRDALSLWHLIPRLDASARGLIYDRLAQMLPPPPDVSRGGIVALDADAIDSWKKVISQLWQ
jgi:hypothetical protein